MEDLPAVLIQIAVVVLVALLLLRLLLGRISVHRPRRARTRRIAAIGVGGAGSNAIDAMVRAKIKGVDFIACNTDLQALRRSRAGRKLQIGHATTGGLGSGGDPAVGRLAAEEDAGRIARTVADYGLVFVTAGLGGGTGSGAAPIVAAAARERGALTVGVVTLPFAFEGVRRAEIAARAVTELERTVDTLIVVANERLHDVTPEAASLTAAFETADGVLRQAVGSITQLIATPGLVNLDFADLRAVLTEGGQSAFGVGRARGDDRAVEAARQALSSPLLERSVGGARSVLFHIAGPANLRLSEVRQAADAIRAAADPGANVVFGATIDRRLRDDVQVTVLATGTDMPSGRPSGEGARRGSDEDAAVPSSGSPEAEPGIDLEVPTFMRSQSRIRRARRPKES